MVFRITFGAGGKAEREEAKRAIALLNGELARLPFEAGDAASVGAAIARAEAIIDERIAPYRDNPLVIPVEGSEAKSPSRPPRPG